MKPLCYVWPYALVFWVAFFWAFAPEGRIIRRARRAQRDRSAPRDASLHVLMAGQAVSVVAAFVLAWRPAFQFAPAHKPYVFGVGIAVLVAGSLLRRHCWRMLGASFTGNVRASADQQVVTRGAYRVLRHPSYTAGILMNAGLGLAMGSWASALAASLGSFAAYVYRIRFEERTLAEVIGEPYRDFMRARKRLVPFVY